MTQPIGPTERIEYWKGLYLDAVAEGQNLADESVKRGALWRERRDVFVECISAYERLRGYLIIRYNDNSTNREVSAWLADHGHGLFVDGIPEADDWRERFWPGDGEQPDNEGQRLTNSETDELVQANYEEALADGEPWAVEAHATRRSAMLGEETLRTILIPTLGA